MDEVNKETELRVRRVVKISRKKFTATVIIVIIIAFLWYMGTRTFSTRGGYSTMTNGSAPTASFPIAPESMPVSDYYRGNQQQPSITDTREFLKTSFSATIKTRDVPSVVTDVKNIIKGADGRIDNLFSSEKSGQISFVVAKSKFEAFKGEIEAITHKKLYSESISSQNLLGQKQGIEAQTTSIVGTLDSLNKQKESLTTKHNQTVSSLNNELARIQGELAAVRVNISNTTDSQVTLSLRNQETSLVYQDSAQRQKLASENSGYSTQKQNIDNLIANYNSSLTNVNKQDSQFTDNIETVNGSVNVTWVSLWELATIFSPISPVIIIIILIILILLYLRHTRHLPKVEWQ